MKKIILLLVVASGVLLYGCSTNNSIPPYTTPFTNNFTVTSLNHTKDTVNQGDTIYVNVAGTMTDTALAQAIYPYITVSSGSTVYSYGTATSNLSSTKTPVKLSYTASSGSNGYYNWTGTIMLVGATWVAHKSVLTIAGSFTYELNLSSQGGGTVSASDAGILNAVTPKKSVYVN